jgi:hypothetical protein
VKNIEFDLSGENMEENVTLVFHGFLNLTAKEKLRLTEEINNYFDSIDREPIREDNKTKFKSIDLTLPGKSCKCCGR